MNDKLVLVTLYGFINLLLKFSSILISLWLNFALIFLLNVAAIVRYRFGLKVGAAWTHRVFYISIPNFLVHSKLEFLRSHCL